MDRRTLLLGTGVITAMGVSAKALAMDASLPMKAADIDPAFEKRALTYPGLYFSKTSSKA
jgi:hypothetical protein